jgi:serine/threonine-protein kinase HipA
MSVRAIEVRAWNTPVGAVAPDPRSGVYAFQYYPEWVRGGIELAPLTMPLSAGSDRVWQFPDVNESFRKLPGLLSDSLPDDFGNALVDAWMAGRGLRKEDITTLDRLAYMGRRGMGALEFRPDQGPKAKKEAEVPLALQQLVEEARALVHGRISEESAQTSLQHLIKVGTSAGGARAKAVIAWHPQTGEIRSGQFDAAPGFEHWLIKFDGMGPDGELGVGSDYGRIEYAYYLMATAAGLTMAPCRLLPEGQRAHFMTKRFDRTGNVRHHMQTLCALDHLSYRQRGTHAYEQYLMIVKDGLKLGDEALQEAFRRMAFNVAGRNHDDHTKNLGFLLPKGGSWQLAPAYDVTHAYNPQGEWTRSHLMSVNGKFADIGRDDLLKVGERFGVPEAAQILGRVDEAVQSWPQFAAEAGLVAATVEKIARNHVRLAASKP